MAASLISRILSLQSALRSASQLSSGILTPSAQADVTAASAIVPPPASLYSTSEQQRVKHELHKRQATSQTCGLPSTTSTPYTSRIHEAGTVYIYSPYTACPVTTYASQTITSGTLYSAVTTTLATPSGTVAGTVEVISPTPIYCNGPSGTSQPASPSATGNAGIRYAIYNSTYFNSPPFPADGTSGFQNYQPNSFDNQTAVHQGTTSFFGLNTTTGSSNVPVRVYPDTTEVFSVAQLTIIHRGFLYARVSGTYKFTSVYVDDIVLFWTGQNAISGGTRANANLVTTYKDSQTPISYSQTLTAGQYLPIRLQYADGGPPGGFTFTITGPDGRTLAGPNGFTDVVAYACDNSTPAETPVTASDTVSPTARATRRARL